MPLADPRPILAAARSARHGVGAFNTTLLEHTEALVAGAEAADAPLVVQISENAVRYHGGLRPLALASLALAESATVPVVLHLDHAESVELVHQAVDLGFTSVMFDGSRLPDDENRATTAQVVSFCHAHGVAVEAELGEIGGKDGVHAPGVRTDPAQARRFCADTGVDSLAVAVGTAHAMASRDAVLDLDLVAAIAEVVPVPLVLHGSSGVDDDTLRTVVTRGMTKINIATHLNKVFTREIRERLDADPKLLDARAYVAPARDAMAAEVERLLRLLGPQTAAVGS
ncbi:class II fructose-bisphosphate aldolase [Micromonospora sp. NBS 11-29]|uniref:class II fructose-bisphosphate aldolase n=1 Tax=Micromonospora sp. NBS 11-29 TaxID=1960879 RepID=UPI000B7827E5|nr:class II fructose-bisphosphate aldolase [Micromonospora sp. NBS 11-29]